MMPGICVAICGDDGRQWFDPHNPMENLLVIELLDEFAVVDSFLRDTHHSRENAHVFRFIATSKMHRLSMAPRTEYTRTKISRRC
jgi:hypothetical protein